VGPAVERQPFRLGEAFVHPFEKRLEQVIGPERRAVGKNGARFRRAEVAHIAAGNAPWLGVHVKEKIPARALVHHEHTDFICAQGAADGAVDPRERELLHTVVSTPKFDFDREPGAVLFEQVQEGALNHPTGHGHA
jgi:hypothetical protein